MDASNFARLATELPAIQEALREQRLGGWLLYDLHARNPVAGRLLGLGDLTRRYFVFIPGSGDPVAVTHGIEQGPWAEWPWRRVRYIGWRELSESLKNLLGGVDVVAMEVSAGDAVPALDLVPAGVQELVQASGPRVQASGDLVTRFHARWSEEGLASHRRAARAVAEVAAGAFDWIRRAERAGEQPTEGAVRDVVVNALAARGVGFGADAIVASGAHAANPHYHPQGAGAPLQPDQVVLLDLWGKESPAGIFADQTWMGFLGAEVPERVLELWTAVRDARNLAVEFLTGHWRAGRTVQGYQVDDAVRGLLEQRGYGSAFLHRTGHSIDQDLHGMGPNIDNLETRETRQLIPGIGFSIEPGIYLAGDIGLRTEINVYMGADGPEVTTPGAQQALYPLL